MIRFLGVEVWSDLIHIHNHLLMKVRFMSQVHIATIFRTSSPSLYSVPADVTNSEKRTSPANTSLQYFILAGGSKSA